MYKIVRHYYPGFDGSNCPNKTIKTGLTLEEARAHCNNPKTQKLELYFDSYTKE